MISSEGTMRIRHCVLTVMLGSALLGLAACNRVGDDWKSAQAADTSEAYQQFIQQHQDSEFATKAQERIRQLSEDREWQAASGQDTREGYEQFLAQHAESKWAQEARARIDIFKQTAAAEAAPAPATADAAPAVANGAAPEPVAAPAPAPAPAVAQAPQSKPAAVMQAAPAKAAPHNAAPAKATAAAKPAAKPIRVATVSGTHFAQLGAFSSRERAEQEWKSLHTRLGEELGTLQPRYTTGKNGSQLVYRLQVGMATQEQVADLCARLRKRSQACIPGRG
jgi:cell division septation protein DedD